MRNSDVAARIGAAVEVIAILFNLLAAFLWFISFIWVLIGLLWGLVALVALVQGAIALFVMVKGYSPVGIAGPLLGIGVSLCNFNFFAGSIEVLVLLLMIGALVLRGQEDAAGA